jgi:hypothetical protein
MTALGRLGILAGILSLPAAASAQGVGDYVNFEAPQVKPITLATIGTQTFLFACNTPDGSVESYEITGTHRDAPLPLFRIPVGAEPVSVVYYSFANPSPNPPTQMLYVVNWLGDSVTFIQLNVVGGALKYEVTREVAVTSPRDAQAPPFQPGGGAASVPLLRGDDQPMHLAVFDRTIGGATKRFLVVSKRGGSSYAQIDPLTGAPQQVFDPTNPTPAVDNGANVIMTHDPSSTNNGQFPVGAAIANSPTFSNATFLALKEPHAVVVRPQSNEFWVLATQGGGSKPAHAHSDPNFPAYTPFDFDVWGIVNPTAAPSFQAIAGLGTTNFNMSFSRDGRYLYVVSTDAQNNVVGNDALRALSTGFVKTLLHQIDFNNNRALRTRDLNTTALGAPVSAGLSLAHATDVVVYHRPQIQQGKTISPAKDFVCLVGFNSDRFAVVDTIDGTGAPTDPNTWPISGVPVETGGVHDPNNAAGPRGLVVWESGTAANDRAYLLNRLDNSITIVDPRAGQGGPVWKNKLPLMREARPASLVAGQKFLYSTDFSNTRFVACASCHVDARSDQLPWRLDMPPPAPLPFHATPPLLAANQRDGVEVGLVADIDQLPGGIGADPQFPFETKSHSLVNGKGPMVTQSLQGLLNFEVGGDLLQDPNPGDNDEDFSRNVFDDLITNAPYHWRGDKDNFTHFNEAFVKLQGMAQFVTTDKPSGGVSTADMKAFETFVNTIHYPPNALQPKNRIYDGAVPSDFNSVAPGNGSGARRGLMLFHTLPVPSSGLFAGRSCVQCHFLPEGSNNRITCIEAGKDLSSNPTDLFEQPLESTALRGMAQKHAILELSAVVLPPTSTGLVPQWRCGDGGMGHEGIGRGRTPGEFVFPVSSLTLVDKTDINDYMRQFDQGIAPMVGSTLLVAPTTVAADLAPMEAEAKKANCGIAVYARLDAGGGTFVEKGYWYLFDPNNAVEPVYKEVGSSSTFSTAALLTLAQTGSSGQHMIFRATPLGSERRVAATNGIGESAGPLVAANIQIVGTTPNSANVDIPNMLKNWVPGTGSLDFNFTGTHRTPLSLENVRTFQTALNSKGVLLRHDAPRRLQVTGDGIQQGARMRLVLPQGNKTIEMPVFPTMTFFAGKRVWETAVEFDPMSLYTLMLGGPADAEVRKVLDNSGPANLTIQQVNVSVSNTPDVPASWTTPASSPIPYFLGGP